MNLFPNKDERNRIILVAGGFIFILLMILLGRVVGDGFLVPLVFIIGWLILMLLTANYFVNRKKSKDKT
jgi:lipopolysaccharide export LptBFGC system permease protein LptF